MGKSARNSSNLGSLNIVHIDSFFRGEFTADHGDEFLHMVDIA